MIGALLEGMSMGLLLSAMVGPVFFSLIQGSLEKGFRYAAVLALGILVSDSVYVLITYYGVTFLADLPNYEKVLGYVGGVILIGFGLGSFLKISRQRPNSGGIQLSEARKKTAFLKGLSINGINPFVLLFWISIASVVQVKEHFTRSDVAVYYGGILGTVFTIDLIKALIAKKLRPLVTPQVMSKLNLGVGLLMIAFGIRMLWWAVGR
ncbi:LysE family translocator [Algoriphagus halophytocola]|uniref:LysE family translocator n=1 Tax=Algoriphagus halophytocola TaxID=2991499 RepID=A0ABY6MHQ0_9BACT|nr:MULTISPECIES: LysE family translocator [unclassified Algoriphagus]UZD23315.1 LysE family translocator [Algoriphagus sp. TR-M5]WBL44610.1 LysE family translocator [Algoriphagus sp. TR-M9]